MKVVIFGSNGMLGSYLKKYLEDKYDLLNLTRNDIDVSVINESNLLNFLRNNITKDDVILNACGVIKQRNPAIIDMIMVNSVFPNILAKFKTEVGCNIVNITTDCVFSGERGNYIETDKHDSIDAYGKSKSLGENPTITNIRTSIIGEEKMNKKSLLEWVISNKGKTIEGYENHLWNGVTCLELAKLIDKIIKNNTYWSGVRHVFSPDTISKYKLINMINEIYKLNIVVNKKTTDINCYRNLQTQFTPMINKSIYDQILELREFKL
jgi:dTDP-4-dehydrorhamnose reductase